MSKYKSRMEREMLLEERRHMHSDMINAVFDKVMLENRKLKEMERHEDSQEITASQSPDHQSRALGATECD